MSLEQFGGSPEKAFREKATVNGIELSVYKDEDSGDYEIRFPQVELGDIADAKGVADQVIRLSEESGTAKQVFEYASKLAETESDVYEIYKKVDEFSRTL